MLKRLPLALIGLILWATAACASCGNTNPNCIVPTAPPGTSNNQAASTAFVQNAVGGGITFPIALNKGGTNANLTASNGGIVYSTASSFAVLAGTVTANQCLLSGASGPPVWGSCSGGGAAVSSVSNIDGSLTISPTTGNVIASCATATTSQLGCVKPDGTTITISAGVISAVGGGGTVSSVSGTAGQITVSPTTGAVVVSLPATITQAETFSAGITVATSFTATGLVTNADLANSTISGISLGSNLANLTATDGSLTFSGSYNGGTARTVGCTTATTSQIGCVKPDGTSITISGGVITASAGGTGCTVSGTAGQLVTNVGGGSGCSSQSMTLSGGAFAPGTDSTTAFQIDNAARSATIFNVDTTNGRIGINVTNPSLTFIAAAVGGSSTTSSVGVFTSTVSTGSNELIVHNDTNAGAAGINVTNSAGAGTSLINIANSSQIFSIFGSSGLFIGAGVPTAPVVFFSGGTALTNKRGQIGGTSGGWCIGNCAVDSGAGTINFAGSSSGTSSLAAAAAATGVLTLPNDTDTLADLAGTQTLTNKTLSTALNTITQGSASVFGILKVDGTTITASGGVISAVGGSTSALHESLFTSGGTFTPTNTALYKITITGGGGLGGASTFVPGAGGSGGGGAGATCIYYATLTASTGYTLTVGAGSTIGSPTAGNSTFVNGATTVTAGHGLNGGAGGSTGAGGAGGAGGTCTNATLGPVAGGDGGPGGAGDADLAGSSAGSGGTGGGGGGMGGIGGGAANAGAVFGSAGGGAGGGTVNGEGAGKQGAILIEGVY